ncbi:SDR family NAD(P)-dependent oxidoreductase [Pseudomonas sp. xss_2]|uniref:SDR family NAD(P)-dependent oxidoreductase n=1 Tax=Pseudomonas sp. xss_2 TaxID=3367215 RepID=UPI00370A3AD7
MHLPLNGKRAIVTASTTGLGLAIVIGLVQAGAEVVLNGRSQAHVDEAFRQVREALPAARIIGVAADLSTDQGTQTLIERVPHTDILVNGLAVVQACATSLARHYAQGMVARNWGRLVFLCAERELKTLVRGMGETLASTGVRVDAVVPGVAEQVATRVVDLAAVGVQPLC